MGDPGFAELAALRMVFRRYIHGGHHTAAFQCDYLITHRGAAEARELFKGRP